jgi:hypothetical protein
MINRVHFEYRQEGHARRVIAAPALRPVPAFERFDVGDGRWHQDALQHIPPDLLMAIGHLLSGTTNAVVEDDRLTIFLGDIPVTRASGRGVDPKQAATAVGQAVSRTRILRVGATLPVELEEDEAGVIEAAIRDKFMPERMKGFPQPASRLLEKMHRVLDKFRDKRIADEELAASLTDEEREIIRARRANTDRMER